MMKAFMFALLFVLAFSATVFAKGYINGIDADNSPFTYIDTTSGKPTGLDIEAMNWIAKTMGFEITHLPLPWDTIIPNLLAHKIDMICSGMSITEERERLVSFSTPYWKLYNVFIVQKNSPLSVASILTEKIKVGGKRGTSATMILAKARKDLQLRYEMHLYDTNTQMVEDVVTGRIQSAIMDSLAALDIIGHNKPIKIAGTHGKPVNIGVAFRAEDEDLRHMINAGYAKLKADPFWQQLLQKYNIKPNSEIIPPHHLQEF